MYNKFIYLLFDNGRLDDRVVHKVEPAVMNIFKSGIAAGTKLEAHKVFKVGVINLGIHVLDLVDGTACGNTCNNNGRGFIIASWIVVIVWAAPCAVHVNPSLITHGKISNRLEEIKGQARAGKGLVVSISDNLVEKVAITLRQFVIEANQRKLGFRDSLSIGSFNRSLIVQASLFEEREGAIFGVGQVGVSRLLEAVTQVLFKLHVKSPELTRRTQCRLVVEDVNVSTDESGFFFVLTIVGPPKGIRGNGRKAVCLDATNLLASLVKAKRGVVGSHGLLRDEVHLVVTDHLD